MQQIKRALQDRDPLAHAVLTHTKYPLSPAEAAVLIADIQAAEDPMQPVHRFLRGPLTTRVLDILGGDAQQCERYFASVYGD